MDIYSLEGKKKIIESYSPKTKVFKNSVSAFFFGGLISLIAELLRRLFISLDIPEKDALTLVGVTLIVAASVLTAIGVFDKIAKHAGAGTLVPITGFSNAITSEALDSKSEGLVLGLGAKIFTVAGPVILYGISCGVLYGIIYFIYLYIIR
jgi:stage V sporulation protein AC